MKKAASIEPAPFEPACIVYGRDEDNKPHASAFGANDVTLANKAAAIMRMTFVPVTDPDSRALALALPQGKIFASGRGFTPFCKEAVFEQLAALGGEVPPMPEGAYPDVEGQTAPLAFTSTAATRDGIIIGARVLAPESDPDAGFFEAVIEEEKPEGVCVLRWLGWPELPAFVRHRDDLGLLPLGRQLDDDEQPAADEASA